MSLTNYTTLILVDYSNFNFIKTEYSNETTDNKKYIPIFGIGTIDETLAWSKHARRIKFTLEAINYYNIPENVVDSNIEEPGKDKLFYEDNKPYCDYLIGKTVGIVKRVIVNGEKIDKYHCPKFELIEINYPHMFHMCTVKVKNLKTGEILSDINIARVAIPELVNIKN